MDHYIVLDLEDWTTRDNLQYVLNKHIELGYKIAHVIAGHAAGQFPEMHKREALIILEQQPSNMVDELKNIRELDAEIHELIQAGLIEKRDCGYALTSH